MTVRSALRGVGLLLTAAGMVVVGTLARAEVPPPVAPTANYFGGVPNYANSPTTMRKFVDKLPGIAAPDAPTGRFNATDFIPVANKIAYPADPNADYYEIGLVEYTQRLHADLGLTKLRGYKDLSPAADGNAHYLGPIILADKGRPVRIKFTNQLALDVAGDPNSAGKLFLPVDKTAMGAGTGPNGGTALFPENRAVLHLHGGDTPWISDGTPHQWITPAGQAGPYLRGVSQRNVPDMTDPGAGAATYYYPNNQSARLMFYHDHTHGMTRLNVYAGEAAGYLLRDPTEADLINRGILPNLGGAYQWGIPLVIQDKTFQSSTTATTDPTFSSVVPTSAVAAGNLWWPHVYMPNQNPNVAAGANDMGRWDYGPWFWPPLTFTTNGAFTVAGTGPGPVGNGCDVGTTCQVPGTPNPSLVPESFLDTPVVNGKAYPTLTVDRKAYRFRILNAANDRFWNLSLFYAADAAGNPCKPGLPGAVTTGCTEVKMVDAIPRPLCSATVTTNCTCDVAAPAGCFPPTWPTDARVGGVPDPLLAGPSFIQIGTEGGFLPKPAVVPPQPVNYVYNRRDIVVLNVAEHALFMGPAERADVIVDFSNVPAGSTLILYNDSPAPVPAADPRLDYYTGAPDQTAFGGAPTPVAGFGPNTRTIMQFVVSGTTGPGVNANLDAEITAAFNASQPKIIVPEPEYSNLLTPAATYPDAYARIQSTSLTFTPVGGGTPVTVPLLPKAIHELFETNYGRMNALLGVERPFTDFTTQTTIPYFYVDPPTEVFRNGQTQYWKITHNGVDTHAIHFHLFNVQVINRVGWDGAIRPPDENELGWKETVRMNPLEDIVIAMRAKVPEVPFPLPVSVRLLDPTEPAGTTGQFTGVDPMNNPIVVVNQPTNFGHEYVWHCHLLGHEENDMMRPVVVRAREKHDLDGDGYADILWQHSSTSQLYLWSMKGATISAQGLIGAGARAAPWTVFGSGDFDGDGIADLVWYNTATGQVDIWFLHGTTVVRQATVGGAGAPWQLAAIGDFDGDGKNDLLWRNGTTGQTYVWFVDGSTVVNQGFTSATISGSVTVGAVGDFDGDGKADVAWLRPNGNVTVWLMNGATVRTAATIGGAGSPWQLVGSGDLDGDGKFDLVWRNSTTGAAYVWFLNGAAIASQGLVHGGSLAGNVADWALRGISDVDFDGKWDLVWHDNVTGDTALWFMDGLAVTSQGAPGAPPVAWQILF